MAAGRPSKPWRLVMPSPDGPVYSPQSSEAAARAAVESEKTTTTAARIVVQRWQDGQWSEWLRWVRNGNAWRAE
ncbi:hypothetical protein ABZX38_36250 [Streptomyces longwoodensis]|uniref:hypothetical protein n=1 Tax=Streptomyces longwoodensis TaxID=68231 RepID=UPI0033A7F6C6